MIEKIYILYIDSIIYINNEENKFNNNYYHKRVRNIFKNNQIFIINVIYNNSNNKLIN